MVKLEIILLHGNWCAFCPPTEEMLDNVVDRLKNGFAKDVNLKKLDTQTPEAMEVASKHGVTGIPTIIANDQVVQVGLPGSEKELEDKLRRFLE